MYGTNHCVERFCNMFYDFDTAENSLKKCILTYPQTAIIQNLHFGLCVMRVHKDGIGKH
jgi:hypothetical protein